MLVLMWSDRVPDLWVDWCAVTGVDSSVRDEMTLARFASQTSASARVMRSLRPAESSATAAVCWPREFRDRPESLASVLGTCARLALREDTSREQAARALRAGYVAVLVAPEVLSGLGLRREQVLAMTPARLSQDVASLARSEDPLSCGRCAVARWLRVLAGYRDLARFGATNALHELRLSLAEHHDEPVALDWPDHPSLLPPIDRWGHADVYASMHHSSLSAVLATLPFLAELDVAAPSPPAATAPPGPVTEEQIDWDQVDEVLSQADAVNARIAALLEGAD